MILSSTYKKVSIWLNGLKFPKLVKINELHFNNKNSINYDYLPNLEVNHISDN